MSRLVVVSNRTADPRKAAAGGLAVAVGVAIVYWATAALFEAMGSVGQLPPLLAAWSPDAIFGFLGVYFFLKMPT